MKISRRNFLKGSAAATAVLGVNPASATELLSPIKKISHANQFGAFYCEVQDGKIINVLPHETDERPGILTKVQVDRTYSNSRIKYPYVRKSYLEGKANHKELRGKDEYVRVSWEEAAKLVADKIKATPRGNIHNAASSGWNHPGFVNSCFTQTGRFFNIVKGGSVATDGEYSNGAAGFVNPGVVGDMEVYSYQTANKVTAENCEVFVLWGTDLFKCNKIDYNVNNRRADLDYIEWKKKGIKFISIDPIKTETAKMFDADCYYIRPGTDVAFMLGMMHYLYTSGKYDKEFMAKYTDGFDKFLPYLLGETDGIVKDVEWAANISEIPAKKIIELADLFTSKRTYLAGNWANQRSDNGEQNDWALITLASMIGQVGLPGGGFGFSNIDSGNGTGWTDSAGPGSFSQGRNKVKDVIPASRISECILNPGKEINYKGRKVIYPKIDMVYQCGANLLGHHPDTNTLVKALRTLDTYIVQEPWWTPSAKHADIVLPVATTLERNDITVGGA
jgi:trimethylamine-N-oxide reductase (cytochrome c)